jgi:hypothetical protein
MQTQSPFLNQQLGKLKTHLSCKFHTTILAFPGFLRFQNN